MRSVMRVYRAARDFSPFLLIIITSVWEAAPIAAPHGVRHRRTRSLRTRRAEAARRTAKPLRGHRVRRRDHGPGGARDREGHGRRLPLLPRRHKKAGLAD